MLLAIEPLSPALWCLSFKVELERKQGLLKTVWAVHCVVFILECGGSERGKGTKDRLRALEARDHLEVAP